MMICFYCKRPADLVPGTAHCKPCTERAAKAKAFGMARAVAKK